MSLSRPRIRYRALSTCLLGAFALALQPGIAQAQTPTRAAAEEALTIEGTAGLSNDAGWRMLSAPVAGATRADLEDDLDFSVDTGNSLYTREGDTWVPSEQSTPLPNGRGFMLFFFDDEVDPIDPNITIDLPGTAPEGDVTIDGLSSDGRFILLGNPFGTSFDLSALNLTANGFQSVVQIWDPANGGSFRSLNASSDVIAPWQGFIIERTTTGQGTDALTFPASGRTTGGIFIGNTGPGAPPEPPEDAVVVGLELTATDDAGETLARDEAVRLVLAAEATDGWDELDAMKLQPLPSGYVTLSFVGQKDGEPVMKAQESRPLNFTGSMDLPLAFESVGVSGTLTITWPDIENIPAQWGLTFRDDVTGTSVDMREDTSYTFEFSTAAKSQALAAAHPSGLVLLQALAVADASARFHLVVNAEGQVSSEDENDLPGAYALRPGYPNPFRGATTLEYALPQAGPVKLAVYDVLGREVDVLVDGTQSAGVHQVRFEAAGLASGTYICRMQADGKTFTRLITLAR